MSKAPQSIKVVATRDGHYGGRYRRAGSKFDVTERFSSTWMAPLDSAKAKAFLERHEKAREDAQYAAVKAEAAASGEQSAQLEQALQEASEARKREAALLERMEKLEAALAGGSGQKEPAPEVEEEQTSDNDAQEDAAAAEGGDSEEAGDGRRSRRTRRSRS